MASILQTASSAVKNEIAFNSLCREMAKNNVSLACSYIKSAVTGVFTHPANSSITPLALKDRCINLIKTPLLLLRASLLCLPLTNRVTQLGLSLLSPKLSIDCVNSFSLGEAEVCLRYKKTTRIIELSKYVQGKEKDNQIITYTDFKKLGISDKNEIAKILYDLELFNLEEPRKISTELKTILKPLLINNIENCFKQKEEFNPSKLNSHKLGFSSEECLIIFTQLSPELSIDFIYSKDAVCKFVENYFQDKIVQKEQITKSDLDLSKDEQAVFTKLGFTNKDYNDLFLKFLAQSPELEKCSINLKKDVRKHIKNPS